MASKLLKIGIHEAKSQLEVSLRQAFEELEPKLRPPFSLAIPSAQEYLQLNHAILYGLLTEPQLAKTHVKHLHAIVTDGYAFFVHLMVKIVNDLYAKLVDSVKVQLIWIVKEMVGVLGVGFGGLLVSLLRQIIGGDFSDRNLWLCFELVNLFLSKWDCLVEEEPLVLTSALYAYLRLLADHCRLSSNVKLESLKLLEIKFCVKMLREQFHLCMKIGRDLIRLLQDLVHVPVFRALWKDLVLNPGEFRTAGFSDVSQLYCSRTSSRYFLLRITPDMETQLRFLLMHVKFGSQKRYQLWFAKKFLFGPEKETLIVDIVRFICCAHHPSNETIQSDIIPRWTVIGWLLKTCRKNYVQANVKLALFYDWLFFDERIDNIMNIEPGMLLMVCSIPKYIDMTHSLLEFLLLLVENYDVHRTHVIVRGLSSAFNSLVQKGVVRSLDVLTSCDALSPFLKERLGRLLSSLKVGVLNKIQLAHLPHDFVPPLSLQNLSCLKSPMPTLEQQPADEVEVRLNTEHANTSFTFSDSLVTTSCPSISTSESQIDAIENLLQNLADGIKKSSALGLQILETILLSLVNLDDQAPTLVSISPEMLCSRIADQFESIDCKLFSPPDNIPSASCSGHEIRSATALLTRTFILSQHQRMQGMLLFWSKNDFPVGVHLLSYASQLAYEAHAAGYLGKANAIVDNNFAKLCKSDFPLLKFHIDGYFSLLNGRIEHSLEDTVPTSEMDKFITKLVENAFAAYKCFLECSRTALHKLDDISLSKLLICDIVSCLAWERKKAKFLFCSIFHHFADLCIGEEEIIRLLVSQLDHADLVDIQFEIGLKKFSIFGENTETIFVLVKNSLSWDSLEQHKFWGLIRSELAISEVLVEKIILQFLSCADLDVNISAIAVAGLLTLCSSCAPTPELVGTIMILPDNVFLDFAATSLATWIKSNPSMLFDSLVKFSEKLDKNGDVSAGITINRSAVLWLLNYFTTQGLNASDMLSNLSSNIQGG
ncbi:hypothetical protein P3X46_012360 [Hevea brasiliensis]|uniref:Integrator complex subunit 3 homolog n=2 Tax=Hevea brasiliensis TaxID=3981 RepID=A0ABQ9M9Y9_HEVBR|nr:uncharacterized protein LOC110638901 isoform X2 [Hevea brasiliensis]XP_058006112.1 uncharacterized protein LOC110638901 isoform X2 [Hevea brasiliensis]XP_058006113.1 uncharacterized protein LOC110638901 isoform X2 [Hevea brasiliensis]XP_058006114.1 uncharacterized protein LOC110638901 isoform X2 [Hevea brasiliensis]KAJ9177109.1 hypothetical protein P3X46_012360 [Hevea brasiliensis]